MIVFDLKCSGGHVFEAWFKNSQTFEDQQVAGDIACPVCGDIGIVKAIMAPNISLGASRGAAAEHLEAAQDAAHQAGLEVAQKKDAAKTAGPAAAEIRTAQPLPEEFKKALEGLKQMVRDNCDDVGKSFAEEARKIHYGEAAPRGIYGQATVQESQELREEGVDFVSLPVPIRGDS